jgi:S-adenosylmethionine hydrolase
MADDKRSLITLTTDFGTSEGYAGVMKGVILALNPQATIVDLTHEIPPQSVRDAAYVLRTAYEFFPLSTIHVVVVDPGVGTQRRAIAVRGETITFVAPDNGVLSYTLDHLRVKAEEIEAVHLTNPSYWLPEVSGVFHGRDVFAPVAAHLSLGLPLDQLGPQIQDLVTLPSPYLDRQQDRIVGQVMHIDHFGNVLTNLPSSDVESLGPDVTVRLDQLQIVGLKRAFAFGEKGEPTAYIDSSGHLAVAVVDGSAQDQLQCRIGDRVEVRPRRALSPGQGMPSD